MGKQYHPRDWKKIDPGSQIFWFHQLHRLLPMKRAQRTCFAKSVNTACWVNVSSTMPTPPITSSKEDSASFFSCFTCSIAWFCSCWVARLLLGNASHFLVRSDELHRCDYFPSLSNPQYQLVWSSWECLSTELCLRLYIWEKLSKRKSRCLSLHEHFQWILLRLAPIQFSIFPIWISCASIVPLVCFLHPMVVSTVEALVDNASVASH